MSAKRRIGIAVALVLVVGIILRFILPDIGKVGTPLVSVRAEELFRIGGFVVTNSLLATVIVTFLILTPLAFFATRRLRAGDEQALKEPRGLQNVMELMVEQLYVLFEGINARYIARFFALVATIFFLVLPSNWLGVMPGVGSVGICVSAAHSGEVVTAEGGIEVVNPAVAEQHAAESDAGEAAGLSNSCAKRTDEYTVFHPLLRAPSADLNMTLMLALVSFLYTEFWGFRANGIGYLGKFFNFKQGPIQFAVGIIEFISEWARILAFAFRLFGNIFAGEVVLLVMAFLFPYLLSLPFYGLELFVGFIQAFVFAVLTMAFLDMAVESHADHDETHEEHAGHSPVPASEHL